MSELVEQDQFRTLTSHEIDLVSGGDGDGNGGSNGVSNGGSSSAGHGGGGRNIDDFTYLAGSLPEWE